jgi:hypothetical protein
VAVRAGHTSVAFTLDRYGHLFEGHDAELRERLDAMHAVGLQGAAKGSVLEFQPGAFSAPARAQCGPEQADQLRSPAAYRA